MERQRLPAATEGLRAELERLKKLGFAATPEMAAGFAYESDDQGIVPKDAHFPTVGGHFSAGREVYASAALFDEALAKLREAALDKARDVTSQAELVHLWILVEPALHDDEVSELYASVFTRLERADQNASQRRRGNGAQLGRS